MQTGIHPDTKQVQVTCSCGNTFETASTVKEDEIRVEICAKCHPFQKKMEEMAKKKK